MKVDEVMSLPVVAAKPTDPVSHAKKLMLRHGLKHLVVFDRGEPVGILSMHDIVKRLGEGSSNWRMRPIDDIPLVRVMHKGVFTVSVGTDLRNATALMLKHNVGSLVVQEGGNIAGVVTKTDITRYFASALAGRFKVRDLMSHELVTVERTHSLMRVTELMKKRGVARVVVVEGEKPAGIITESDVAFAQLEQPRGGIRKSEVRYTRKLERGDRPRARYTKRVASRTAENVMRSEVMTIDAGEDAAHAAALMIEHDISGLPVVEWEKLIGIITKTDLVKGVANLGA